MTKLDCALKWMFEFDSNMKMNNLKHEMKKKVQMPMKFHCAHLLGQKFLFFLMSVC